MFQRLQLQKTESPENKRTPERSAQGSFLWMREVYSDLINFDTYNLSLIFS